MIMRSLQPRFARHLMGFPHTDFGSLVQTLYGIEEGIARGLWSESSPIDSKGRSLQEDRDQEMLQRDLLPHTPNPKLHRPPIMCRGHHANLINWPSVTTNPLPAHSTHAVSPSSGNIHHMDLIEDDSIHMLSWDDGLPESIVLHDSYEVDGVSLVPQNSCTIQFDPGRGTIPVDSSYTLSYRMPGCFVLFTLWPKDDDSDWREVQIVTRSGRIAQPPPAAVRPFEGAASHEEVKREDDEIRVETTTTPERLIHMMTVGRATCIVFSDDDLPPDGLDHVHPLYITVGFSSHRVPSVLLDNDSALNVCPLATAIALVSRLQILVLLLRQSGRMIAPRGRIPSSFNLLLGRPWIHIAGVIPSSLHQKVKFIHDGQVIKVRSTRDIFVVSELVLQISHSEDDLLLTGFTFDEIQTLEIEDFCRDFVAMTTSAGTSEFIAAIDHDTTFGLGFIPTEADYRYMARLCKERIERLSFSHLFHQLQLSNGVHGASISMATPTSPDRASMLSLCFPEEITDDGDDRELNDQHCSASTISPFDMFGVSTIEYFEYSPASCDSTFIDAPHSPTSQIFDINDEVAWPDPDRNSSDHDSDPVDERVSHATGDVETVDFGTEDQPRELKIGSPLSTVQHHLPILPHARPVK
ncbi:hypothetical protein CK203_099638 [Vitis vinifera]|uniref:Uncharacterized protein n=1 Tax=Vitis vinifera TaxID=29760 RepID=A0A438DNF1_VITVI|nr:hypothetical protein CK203_099638 [Vitis vinifera]